MKKLLSTLWILAIQIMIFLLLQSCQYQAQMKADKVVQLKKRADAVSYNIQLGMGYLKQGDTPRAKRKLLMALELAPNSPDAIGAMAYYLEKTGNQNEAKEYYLKALLLAPNNGSQLNNYGTFLCRKGDYAEALIYFLKAVKDANYLHSSGAYENAGLCAAAIPDYQKAKMYFIKALEQDARRKQSLYELVNMELKENQPEQALTYLEKYQELVFKNPTFLALAIDASHKAGKFEMEANYKERMNQLG